MNQFTDAQLIQAYYTEQAKKAGIIKSVPYAVLYELAAAIEKTGKKVKIGPSSRRGAVCDPGYDLVVS